MKNNMNQTTILHYILAMMLLSIYGARVCPFLDTLNFFELVTPIFVAFMTALFIRLNAQKLIDMLTLEKQSKSLFLLEVKTLFFTGLILGIFNTIYFNFPPESGLKVIFGCLLLGIFIGIDQTLLREKFISNKLMQEGKNLIISKSYLSLPGKFIFMSILMIGSITSILLMVIAKDLDWFHEEGIHLEFLQAKISILAEVSFIVLVILSYSIRIILMFSSNLKILLNNQNRVLQTVGNGNLDTHVPVVTHDEFGIMAKGTNIMINELKLQKEEIKTTRDVIILSMAGLAETRDNETGAHIIRTQKYVKALAIYLKNNSKYKDVLTDENIESLYKSAPLHDIGKVGIPDNILLKPGKLTSEEFEIMKNHATIGADAIKSTQGGLKDDAFLNFAQEIAHCHHEKFDGSGYPNGLKGEEIPLSARIMALADVYDALISKRVYKDGFTHEKAKEIILDGENKHFDPIIVKAFINIEEEFRKIKEEFQ